MSPHNFVKPGDQPEKTNRWGAEQGMHLSLLESRAPSRCTSHPDVMTQLGQDKALRFPSSGVLSSTQVPFPRLNTHNFLWKASNSEPNRPRLKAQLYCTPQSLLSTLSLGFLVCKMGTLISTVSVRELAKNEYFPEKEEMRETSWAH